jgi:hypothetical protein
MCRFGLSHDRLSPRAFAAAEILADGFRDTEGAYLTPKVFGGVSVGDQPLAENEGVDGDRVLAVDIPEVVIAGLSGSRTASHIENGLFPPEYSTYIRWPRQSPAATTSMEGTPSPSDSILLRPRSARPGRLPGRLPTPAL